MELNADILMRFVLFQFQRLELRPPFFSEKSKKQQQQQKKSNNNSNLESSLL